MLYETQNQPFVFLMIVLFGFLSGFLFDFLNISKIILKKQFIINFLTLFMVFSAIFIYFFINLKFNYGEFRFYTIFSFFLSFFIQRLTLSNFVASRFELCYNKHIKKKTERKNETKLKKRKKDK